MERVVEVSARSGHHYEITTDARAGGATTLEVKRVGDQLLLDCRIAAKVDWPYCQIRFTVGLPQSGLDLSEFDHVSLDLDYDGPQPHRAKLVLVNFDRGYSREGAWITNTVNEIEGIEIPPGQVVELPMNIFAVARWWIEDARPPKRESGTRFDNVTHVELLTAAGSQPGRNLLTLRSIRFHGKLISANRLLTILIGVWIASAMGWAGLLSWKLRAELSTSKAKLRMLGEAAHHDPLTGALNREGMRAELMSEPAFLAAPLSVVFLDIDHFKRVNDTHGHDVGDQVLRHFAAAVAANVRASDKLVRWGGEEFLLVCPGADVHQAAALAEKLRLSLQQERWPLGLAVTSSFGVAQRNGPEEIGAVITRADHQLYGAKESGRNRVHADYAGSGVAQTDQRIEQIRA